MTAETTTAQSSGNTKPSLSEVVWRGRAFQLTLNDVTRYDDLKNEFKKLKSCDYYISCKETAPTTGHEHIHIYVHFQSSYKLNRKILSHGAHIELCKGSPQSNIDYIKKDGNILDEWGDPPHQGYHTVKELRELKSPDDLNWNEYNTWVKIQHAPTKQKTNEWSKDIKVYYISGPPGCGKSNYAQKLMEDNGILEFDEVKHVGEFWHGVIDGQGCCVYDDWRDSHMCASEFINFIDYRCHNLNVKGGSVRNNYSTIIITTVQSLKNIYINCDDEPRKQWERRMTWYKYVDGSFVMRCI